MVESGANVKIIVHTEGAEVGTIVLKGIANTGTFTSLQDLIDAGYKITFDA